MHKNDRKLIYVNIKNWIHTFLSLDMDNASINIDQPIHNTWQTTLLYPFENELDHYATTFLLPSSL